MSFPVPRTNLIYLFYILGDSCCFFFSLGALQKKLNASLPGVHILSLRIGSNIVEDVENGYLMHPDKQIKEACDIINSDPLLSNGFNAIGFSQGGQFLRGLVQRCPSAKVKKFDISRRTTSRSVWSSELWITVSFYLRLFKAPFKSRRLYRIENRILKLLLLMRS
ncbi:hypothetical protein NQ314_006772 [Rhamnusium bicolor]|uniref:Palmitoyl-protein thioesterase 1 n=1 Tax=Rhamnusium bicolor TaxID=1586634 RepID=A0AAV8YZE6_9CUCU|nr:hypothetical protein NQ314_006772 [Rhamnusium bicolor]